MAAFQSERKVTIRPCSPLVLQDLWGIDQHMDILSNLRSRGEGWNAMM